MLIDHSRLLGKQGLRPRRSHLPLTLEKQGRAQVSHSPKGNPYGFPLVTPSFRMEVQVRR